MILGLEFPPISHVVEWPVGPLGINKVVVLMWISTLIAFGVMCLGGRKKALVPTGIQNVAESAVDFVEEGIVLQTIGPDGLKFTPFLITLFTFILTCNIWGLVPGRADAGERPHRPARVHGAAGVRHLPHRRRHLSGPASPT